MGVVSGTSTALESIETTFQQDLNGDGVIGLPPPPPPIVIESFGSTKLDQVGSNFFLDPVAGAAGSGPELKYNGAAFVVNQFGWAALGAEQTAGGYKVAWRVLGADQFTV